MQLSESFRPADQAPKTEAFDVRKEAERMVRRHERQLQKLREFSDSPQAFREAALQSTEQFKADLLSFLKAHNAEELYEDLVGFVSGKVAEIVSGGTERSSLS